MTNEMDKFNKILKRKRRRKLLAFAFLFLVIIAAVIISALIIFSIHIIQIDNQTNYDACEILDNIHLSSGDFLLSLREDKLEKQILKNFPYIAAADFRFSYHGTVSMVLRSAVPAYCVALEEGYLILDSGFKILEMAQTKPGGVLPVQGMTVEEYDTGSVLTSDESLEVEVLDELIENLKNAGLFERLSLIDFTKKYNTVFVLDGRVEVEVGTSEDIDKKIELMVSILEKNPTDKKMNINVRNYTQGRCRILDE